MDSCKGSVKGKDKDDELANMLSQKGKEAKGEGKGMDKGKQKRMSLYQKPARSPVRRAAPPIKMRGSVAAMMESAAAGSSGSSGSSGSLVVQTKSASCEPAIKKQKAEKPAAKRPKVKPEMQQAEKKEHG